MTLASQGRNPQLEHDVKLVPTGLKANSRQSTPRAGRERAVGEAQGPPSMNGLGTG